MGGPRVTQEEWKRIDELDEAKVSTKEISDKICEEFERETLDTSTIWRHRRNRVQAEKSQAPVGSRGIAPVDAIYQRAGLKHVEKLTEVFQVFGDQLNLLPPHEAGSWMPPHEPGSGVLPIYTGGSQAMHSPGFLWNPAARRSLLGSFDCPWKATCISLRFSVTYRTLICGHNSKHLGMKLMHIS